MRTSEMLVWYIQLVLQCNSLIHMWLDVIYTVSTNWAGQCIPNDALFDLCLCKGNQNTPNVISSTSWIRIQFLCILYKMCCKTWTVWHKTNKGKQNTFNVILNIPKTFEWISFLFKCLETSIHAVVGVKV